MTPIRRNKGAANKIGELMRSKAAKAIVPIALGPHRNKVKVTPTPPRAKDTGTPVANTRNKLPKRIMVTVKISILFMVLESLKLPNIFCYAL
jgi:hypothetical protein